MVFSPELIKFIIYAIIIFAIFIFLIKKAIAIAVCLGIMLIIFNIGFRYDGDDIKNKLKIGDYVETETANKIADFFDDFASKRNDFGIVDTDKVYEGMTDAIEKGYYIAIEGLGKVDINKFAKTLANDIYESGLKNIDFNELVSEIQKQLKVDKSQAIEIANDVMNEYNKID